MTSPDNSLPSQDREAGFTLIELIVVFAILGLVLALFVGRANGPSAGLSLRVAANDLAAGLREARAVAIAANRPIGVVIDAAHKQWRATDGTIRPLPVGAVVAVALADGRGADNEPVSIRFEPDGSASGGRVVLATDRQRIAVGVDWITGRVTVADVR